MILPLPQILGLLNLFMMLTATYNKIKSKLWLDHMHMRSVGGQFQSNKFIIIHGFKPEHFYGPEKPLRDCS